MNFKFMFAIFYLIKNHLNNLDKIRHVKFTTNNNSKKHNKF